MRENLLQFIIDKKLDGDFKQGEEATKQGLILPILHYLGWNPFNVQEVFPEYSVKSGRVDYSLRFNSINKVFIEVKKINEDLEKHQEQLLKYAFSHGVKLAILTNGVVWWFYLPLHEGNWEQRRFYTIDIHSQSSDDIVDKLNAFLSKQEVIDGRAVQNAENIYNNRQKGEIIRQTLPKAWRKLLSESDDLLAEVVAEATEKICGYKPDADTVVSFLKNVSGETSLPSATKVSRPAVSKTAQQQHTETKEVSQLEVGQTNLIGLQTATFQKPASFEFNNQTYQVNSWTNLLKTLINVLAQKHGTELEKLTILVGKQRPYFTTDRTLLRQAGSVPNSNLFFETHFSAQSILNLISQMLDVMNYPKSAIRINIVDK